jgi:hypothetical protein
MTGHTPSTEQSQEFLSTMHTMIDDLDTITISSAIDEHTYLRLVNGLQRLYTIHNSSNQSPSSVREPVNQRNRFRLRENLPDNNELEITRILAQHYGRVYDSSGVLINNDITTINSDINVIEPNITNVDPNVITNENNENNENNEDNEAHNQQAIYTSYVALYSNAFDYWNQPQHRFRRTN